ncbi:MAG: AraC family transcriptional regulator [Clostridia bacterium]|nr:AraC family transcriptional regulator [Clostridia bacterium]
MEFHIYEKDLDPEFRIYSDNTAENIISPPHINYYAELVVCRRGELLLRVNQRERRLKAGEGTLIHSLEVHEFLPGKENLVSVFCFSPILFSDLLDQKPAGDQAVGALSEECLGYVSYLTKKNLHYPEQEREIQLVLGSLLYEILCLSARPQREQTLAVCRAVTYLEQHYTEQISLEQVARFAGVNRAYVSQMFPKYLNGVTFTQALSQIRVHRAVQLLSRESVTQAALESGFGSVRQFNRVFKAMTGKSPRDYQGISSGETKKKVTMGGMLA